MHPALQDGLGVQGRILLDTVRVTGILCRRKGRMASVDAGIDDMDMTTATRHPVIIVRADGLGDARQEAEAGAELGGKGQGGRKGRARRGGGKRGGGIYHGTFSVKGPVHGVNKQTVVLLYYQCFCVYDSANGNISP